MCAPAALAVAQVGVAAAGAVGQHQSASAAANAQNAAATSNYKHQLQVRSRNWDRERFRYNRALTQYDSKLNENALAAQRAYAGEQTKLNNIYKQASFKQQANLVKLVQGTGRVAASGATGKSAQRLDNQIVGQFGRNQAIAAESLIGAQNAFKTNVNNTNLQQQSSNNKAYESVAVQPMQGVAPPPPVMTPGPSPLSLMANIGGAVVGGFSTYNDLKAPPG